MCIRDSGNRGQTRNVNVGLIFKGLLRICGVETVSYTHLHGFGIAPIVGILLSEIALDGKASTLSTEAFRWDWFG